MGYDQSKMCGNKTKYSSKQQAIYALNAMRQRDKMHPYQCPICHKWHIGHQGEKR